MAVTSIRNETPSILTLNGAENQQLVLAPLQEKVVEDVSAFDFEAAERAGIVRVGTEAPKGFGERISVALIGGGFWIVVACAIISSMDPRWGLAAIQWKWMVWLSGVTLLLAVVAGMSIYATNSFSLVMRLTMQTAALAVILAIGLGLPAATIYFFGGGRYLLGLPDASPLALFGRLIQLSFIATASLLPVLLFFLFDRFQLGTLRKRLYSNLFRLDPSVHTIDEINAKYGSQMRAACGREGQARGRLGPDSRWPVLVCAFVITIGWIVALAPVGLNFSPSTPEEALRVLLPQPTALVFGFLGAYFFSLRLITIRYARGDLKPKAYSHIMVRIVIVVVLSWVLDAIFEGGSRIMLVLAFLFGITPDAFFTWTREAFRSKALPAKIFPEPTKLPLTDLDGIDLYDRGRLESEGIVNIEGLAHHELIDLVIETRVPVPRLIDWIDQAILYLHLAGGSDTGARATLRAYGIRTATDLLETWEGATKRSSGGDDELESFKKLLGGTQKPYRLETIRDAFLDDEWMQTVICWRQNAQRDPIKTDAFPSSVEALARWADRQLELEQYGSALSILARALQIRDTASTRRKIAHIYATSPVAEYRDWDQTRENAQRAFKLAPHEYQGILELIDIYMAIEDYEDAKNMCEAASQVVSKWRNDRQRRRETERLRKLQARVETEMARPVSDEFGREA